MFRHALLRSALAAAVLITSTSTVATAQTAPVIDPTPLGDANVGTEYAGFLSASGGEGTPFTWRLVDGRLPRGLKLEKSFGSASTLIFGTPTRTGTFTFTVQVKDAAGNSSTETFSIVVNEPRPLLITNGSSILREGTVGEDYAANLFADGGVPPYDWEIAAGSLPPGLRLRGNQISGTPTEVGTFAFTAQVTDSAGTQAQQEFSITVN